MNNHSAAVLGASGYAGGELLRYIGLHPSLDLVWATADQNAGKLVGEIFGHLPGLAEVKLEGTDASTVPDVDIAFLALPHGAAADIGRTLASRGIRVVDLSADWRMNNAAAYQQWYDFQHPYPGELSSWIYGLPEMHREQLAEAKTVASPGCYPTAAILPLAPLLKEQVIEADGIVVDAVSGVSGAGRKVDADYLFSELDSSFKAYGVGKHRHTPEIEQELSLAAGSDVVVTLTPHLAPMARGLLATCYTRSTGSVKDIHEVLSTAYKGEPFVRVLPVGSQPVTKHVSGTNDAIIGVGGDARTGTIVLTCAIDNLGKGASGQMIQNANLMLGLDETTGLQSSGLYP